MPAIIAAATFWLQQGLPIECLKLFVFNQDDIDISVQIFQKFALQLKQQEETEKESTVEKKAVVQSWQQRTWKQKISDRIGQLIEEKVMDYLL